MLVRLCCALISLAAAGCASSTTPSGEFAGSAAEGRAVVSDLCAGCHAIGAKGKSPLKTAPPLRTVLSKYDSDALAAGLQRGVLMGHPDLPHVYLDDRSARAVVAYLESLREE